MKKFLIVNEKRLKNEVLNGFLQMIPRLFLEVLAVLSLSLTILFFYIEGNSIKSILPTITLMTVIIIRMLPVFVNLNAGFNNLKYFRSGFDALKNEYINLDKNNQTYQNEENYFDKNKFAEINKININNVNFRYSKNEEKILKNISIQVNKGEFIGIIGKSGAGKSTLIDIILGLLKPEEGKILVNEKNIDLNYKEWQKNIGYVPQDVYLLDDTIKRNIALGKEDKEIDEKKLYSAVELSQLKEFVEDLPDKSNTIMGDRGARISGGQKQRIGIARALYNNSEIIIFDEATSALDIETEKKIIDDIYKLKKNRIIIFITHRTSSLRNCDKIFVISNGKLVDEGAYHDVLSRNQNLNEINQYNDKN